MVRTVRGFNNEADNAFCFCRSQFELSCAKKRQGVNTMLILEHHHAKPISVAARGLLYFPKGSTEPQTRAFFCLLSLNFAIARGRMRVKRSQKTPRGGRHLLDREIEGSRISLRRLVEARQLAHELQRGSVDFLIRRRRLEIEQRLDVSAHFDHPETKHSGKRQAYAKRTSALAAGFIADYSLPT
jgi:hypothetical protein